MKKMLIFLFLFLFIFWFKGLAQESGSQVKKILILPFDVYAQPEYTYLKEAIPEMLVSRLFLPSKIEIIELEKVKEEVKNLGKINGKIAEELGNKFKANYVIWGSVTVLGESVSIDAQIIDLSGNKKPAQFFQEIKNISELISQISRFAQKARMYVEGKEEDFYREPYYAMAPYGISKEHPERGYYYYYPYLYPQGPVERRPKVTRAKSPYGDLAEEGLTRNLVIDISKGTIGWAEDEEKSKNNNATAITPNYPPMYPPQPYYPYSPPPYYYYYQEDEGILSKLWSHIWPFGEKEKTPKYYTTQVLPAPHPYTYPQTPNYSLPETSQSAQIQPYVEPQKQIQPPSTPNTKKKENPWSWE
ncbi:MAG: hypothetical protein C0190_03205 [Thermodesulfobacterium geofontis]|uniref:TolB N-terminal domain-containing protein n=2 Tax=Thermodesulfobacterium geofontis TaxID=1295609 RepID=A0A2N7PNV4_9BACT|nr:MAG: hypothetical protein C0190_03205 [Thermodesulfobacterium geofontis]